MRITLELQMEYIWIDSLCIVQDDVNDWKSEASQMEQVYQNASCNISASAVANGEQGFILPRSFDPTPVTGEIKLLSTNEAIACGPLANTYCFALSNPANELSQSPLFTRAWTLQEQVLASRALHFGKDQMFWECSRTFANEVWPQGWDNAMFDKSAMERFPHDINWQFSFEQIQGHKVGTDNAGTAKSQDILAASSYQTDPLEDTYVFGLWKNDLLRGLLFNQLGAKYAPRSSIIRPNWSDIPSWSWAALYKPVVWYRDPPASQVRELCKFELLDRQTTPILRFTGMLLSVASDEYKSMYLWNAAKHPKGSKGDGLDITIQFDQWFFADFEDRWISCGDADIEDVRKRGMDDCRAAVLFIPIQLYQGHELRGKGRNLESDREEKRARGVKGLLLCAQPDLEHGQYRRAGVCNVEVTADEHIDDEQIMDELRAYGQLHISPAVHETLEDGQFVVSVV